MSTTSIKSFGAFGEAHEVVRAVDLIGDDHHRYRIEVLGLVSDEVTTFSVRCYVVENLTVQPTFPQAHRALLRSPAPFEIWVREDELPTVTEKTADDALDSGLRSLADLVRKRAAVQKVP
jgi:hypothetical protein